MSTLQSSETSPRVSIVIPVYNAMPYLVESIESSLSQDYTNFELVCIDDGSTDTSLSVLNEIAARDNRLRVISRPNTGIVGALNDGISQAQGAYIMRMDADDLSLPTRMSRQVEYLEEHPECALVGCNALMIDEAGSPITTKLSPQTHDKIEECLLQLGESAILHPAIMIRKDKLLEVGGYREQYKYVEDYDLYLRLAEVGCLTCLPDVLIRCRQLPASISRTKKKEQRQLILDCIHEACSRRGINPPASSRLASNLPYEISTARHYINVAVQSILGGYPATARSNSYKAFLLEPWNPLSWFAFILSYFPRSMTRFAVRHLLGREV